MAWDNEDIPENAERCPDCFGSLDDEGYAVTCGCNTETCYTCGGIWYCDLSC